MLEHYLFDICTALLGVVLRGARDCIRARRTLAGGTRIGLYLGVRKYSASKSLTALRGWRITDILLLLAAAASRGYYFVIDHNSLACIFTLGAAAPKPPLP